MKGGEEKKAYKAFFSFPFIPHKHKKNGEV
jgi:hypothetical protein